MQSAWPPVITPGRSHGIATDFAGERDTAIGSFPQGSEPIGTRSVAGQRSYKEVPPPELPLPDVPPVGGHEGGV
jgi:hypothetical protein